MFSDAKQHAIYAIANSHVRLFPFPHFSCDNVFTQNFYDEILARLPDEDRYASIVGTGRLEMSKFGGKNSPYNSRSTIPLTKETVGNFAKKDQAFWLEILHFLKGEDLVKILLWKFEAFLRQRYPSGLKDVYFNSDVLLMRDFRGFSLGPHSDRPNKVAVIIFYLPTTADNPNLGTSVYVPKKQGFVCNTGAHHDRDDFHCVFTTPYLPNSAFAFFKTPNSFHGVEPVKGATVRRNLIQCSIVDS
jgi:hypothetical protein